MPSPENANAGTRSPAEYYRAHAELHARESPAGIGAAVVRSAFEHDEHIWDCIFPNICSEDVELAVERFAAMLPAPNRIRHLLNANPLHLGRDGRVRD
jgi:hypothetical protein